jgi:hypothetical protein
MLDHLSESQVKTSEIRGEVEQTRWQLLQESGVQKTELLRARQDMVSRIIQIGEKGLERILNPRNQKEGIHYVNKKLKYSLSCNAQCISV